MRNETYLLHQAHPLKLAADWAAGLGSLYFFWHHEVAIPIGILLLPPIVASILIVKFVDVAKMRNLKLSKAAKNMTLAIEAVRLLGMAAMIFSAWYHQPLGIVFGLAIILSAWWYSGRH